VRVRVRVRVQILSLIERFYEAEEGLVLLDDTDLSTYDPVWLHSQIGYSCSSIQPLFSLYSASIQALYLHGEKERM